MTGKACAASCSSCIGSRRTDHIRPSPHPPTEGSSPSPHPARASHRWHTPTLLRQPPSRPRFALLPHPLRRNSAGSGFPGEERVRTRSSRLVPVHWTVVDIATGARAVRAIPGGKPCPGAAAEPVSREDREERARIWFFPGISPGRWTVGISPWGGGDGRCGTGSLQARRPGGADGCLRPGTGIPGRPQFQDHPGETDRNNRQNE